MPGESHSDSETMVRKKRKVEEEVKTVNKKKKMETFQRYLNSIIVFHSEKEVHDIIDNIIDGRIESIVKELGISTTLIRFFTVPRTELLEEVKRIVLSGVHLPLKVLISRMPQQVKQLVDLTSNTDEDESIMPEICRLVEKDVEREEEEKKTDSFRKMIIRLQNIRYDILKMIIGALRSESLWKNILVNPINSLKKPAMTTICKEIYVSVIPFSADFCRFFIDDELGFYDDLNDILGNQ